MLKKRYQRVLGNLIILLFALFISTGIFSPSNDKTVFGQTLPNTSPVPTPTQTPRPAPTNDKNQKEPVEDGEVLRVETTLVSVPVSVMDRNSGRYITDLSKEDFRIYEDGVEQEVAYFAAVEKPFTVVLMLDTSASMWSNLGKIKDAAAAFVEQLRPDDSVSIIAFGRGVKVQCEPTSDRQKIRKAIDDVGRGLSTRIYDAMDKVMSKQINRIQGRKALVLFTDGVDATSEDATYESTVRVAEELDALIYPILYDTYDPSADKTGGSTMPTPPPVKSRLPSILRKIPLPLPIPTQGDTQSSGETAPGASRADYDRGERYLKELAELTGGELYEAGRDLSLLRIAFSQIADELRRQYSLGYYPNNSSSVRGKRYKIKIVVNRPNVAVRARSGYIRK